MTPKSEWITVMAGVLPGVLKAIATYPLPAAFLGMCLIAGYAIAKR